MYILRIILEHHFQDLDQENRQETSLEIYVPIAVAAVRPDTEHDLVAVDRLIDGRLNRRPGARRDLQNISISGNYRPYEDQNCTRNTSHPNSFGQITQPVHSVYIKGILK